MRFMDATRLGGFSRRIRTLDELVAALFSSGENGALFDAADLTSMRQGRDGSTAAAVGSPVGYWLDKRLMGGQTAGAFIATLTNRRDTGFTQASGSGTATYNTATGDGSATRGADLNNQGGVVFSGIAGPNSIDVENTGSVNLTVRTGFGGAILATINPGQRVERLYVPTGTAFAINPVANDTTIQFIVHSVREIPGNHAIAPSDAARPVLRQTAGGLYYLEFDGTDDELRLTSATALGMARNVGGFTIGAAYRFTVSPSSNRRIFSVSINSASGSTRAGAIGGTASGQIHVGGRRLDSEGFVSISVAENTNDNILVGVFDYSASNLFLRRNGALSASNTSFQTDGATSDTNSLAVGLGSDGAGGQFFNGRIYRLIALPRVWTDAEQTNAEQWLADGSGVTL
jgi:hypothetical protein